MRLMKQVWCLLMAVAWPLVASVPAVTRHFSAERIGPECAVRVTLEVQFPDAEDLPHVWLLTESWPEGWTVQEPHWNGQPCVPVTHAERSFRGWLFGEPDTPPVANGTLSYILQAPAVFNSSATMNSADGAAFTYNDHHYIEGAETLRPDEAAQVENFTMSIPPGWSLMALPCELDAASREALDGLHDGVAMLGGEEAAFVHGVLPSVGRPFWLHNPTGEAVVAELTATVVQEFPEPLQPAVAVRHQQWNLFGVCGDDPVRLAAGVSAWRWRGDHYEPCEQNAVLQPGEAVWIWVE